MSKVKKILSLPYIEVKKLKYQHFQGIFPTVTKQQFSNGILQDLGKLNEKYVKKSTFLAN